MSKFQKGDRVLYVRKDDEYDDVGIMVGKRGNIVEEHNADLYQVEFVTDVTSSISKVMLLSPDCLDKVTLFKAGDYVELLHRDRHPNEATNFTLEESLQLGTGYKIQSVSTVDNNGHQWIRIFKNGVLHHPDKFKQYIEESTILFKKNDLVRLSKPTSKRHKSVVRVVSLPDENGTNTVLVKDQKDKFFKYAPELLNLVWEYQEFAVDDKIVLADIKHPFDSTDDWAISSDELTMHNIYTVKDVRDNGSIKLDFGVLHHAPEYFKMFDRKDKTKVMSGITQVKRDLERKGHQWISLLNV